MIKLEGTILLVDDEASILNSLKRVFLSEGYTVLAVSSGRDGIKILEEQPVDIIICDMRMPEMDGVALLKIAVERWPHIKRILLTGYSDINSAISAVNEGKIDYYLEKPWHNDQITQIVNNLLENKLLHDQNRSLNALLKQQNNKLKLLNNHLEEKVQERTLELHKSYNDLQATHHAATQVFLSMQELHEGAHRGYCRSVATHARLLAEAMQMTDKEIQTIYLAAMLHNLGKGALSDRVRYKPYMNLTRMERQEFRQYPIIGATILEAFPSLKDVAHIILLHKERLDGRGFPYGVMGEDISLSARILTLAVDYNELQHGLMFPERYHAKLALKFIKDNKERYDAKLVSVFVNAINKVPDDRLALAEVALEPCQLKPGMVLSRDLGFKNGFVFLAKGFSLKPQTISRLVSMGDLVVYIYQDTVNETPGNLGLSK